MAPHARRRAEEVFQTVADLPSSQRETYLRAACAGDTTLERTVRLLLAAHEGEMGDFLAQPVLRAASDQDELPVRVGRYRILRRIGAGGMGMVYEAQQENPRRNVALKLLRPGEASRAMLRRFEHEVAILGQLEHPCIARIYEAGTADVELGTTASVGAVRSEATAPRGAPSYGALPRQPFFAMELVRGTTITEYAESRKLGTRERLRLLERVCEAVHYAHLRGVIHRDLKPGNVLVDELGEPKILDFGVARLTNSDVQTVSLRTDVGQLVGTLPYMSPEQVAGDAALLDARSDVYALGVMLFELLAGRLPHDVRNRSIPEAARIIREDEPSRLSSINPTLRGDIETIVSKALDKERSRRYASAAELAADIRRYLSDEPIHARPPSTWYQISKFSRRNRGLVAGAAAAALILVIGASVATVLAILANQARHEAELRTVQAHRETYRASLAAAAAALRNFDARVAAENLDAAPTALRGWEWRYLNWLSDRSVEVFARNLGPLSGLVASADGNCFAVIDVEGNVQVMDRPSRQVVARLDADTAAPEWAMTMDRSGSLLARVAIGSEISVYDSRSGTLLWRRPSGPTKTPGFSPDGKRIAFADASQRGVSLHDAFSGELLRTYDLRLPNRVLGVEFDASGERMLVHDDGGTHRIYELQTGRAGATFSSWVFALNDDWSRLVLTEENRLILKNSPSGEQLAEYPGLRERLTRMYFLPEQLGLLTVTEAGVSQIYDPALRLVMTYVLPTDLVGACAVRPGGPLLLATRSGVVASWDVFTGAAPLLTPHPPRFVVQSAALSRDRRRAAVGGWGDVRLYDACTGELLWCTFPGRNWVSAVAISPREDRLLIGDSFGRACILSAADGALLRCAALRHEVLLSVAWIDETHVAAGNRSGQLMLMDLDRPDAARLVDAHRSPIHCLSLSPDGATLASGAGDGVDYGDLERISSGSRDSSVKLWDAKTWTCRATMTCAAAVTALAHSPDGRLLAAACLDGTVQVQDASSLRSVATLRDVGECRALAFHPVEPRLSAWSMDGTVRVWETHTFEELVVMHTGVVATKTAGFTPDGTTLVASGRAVAVAALETALPPCGQRERFIQALAASATRPLERLLADDAAAELSTDRLLAEPLRAAALTELRRRGDHLNWMVSDAIIHMQQREQGGPPELLDTADRKIRIAIARKDDEPGPWAVLGELKYRQGEFDAAVSALERAVGLYERRDAPPTARVLSWLALAYNGAGNPQAARRTLARARAAHEAGVTDTAGQNALSEATRIIEGGGP